jgi:hypothetical protein
VALTRTRSIAILGSAVVLVGLLAYLRDPGWLINVSSGLGPWRTDAAGVRFRRMGGRGSFFVPADAEAVVVPVRAPFRSPSDWPITATFFVDDRPVERTVLGDGTWRNVRIPLVRATGRRVRRIDIHADHTRTWNHGLDVGAVAVENDSRKELQ